MRITIISLLAGTLLATAGCQKAPEPAKAPEVETSISGERVRRQAGTWQSKLTVMDMAMPGLPDSMRQKLTDMVEKQGSQSVCLTPEQAAKEDIADRLAKIGNNDKCNFTRKAIDGGKVDIGATCTAGGQKVDVKMQGTVTPTRADMMMVTTGAGNVAMTMRIVSQRTGDCTAP